MHSRFIYGSDETEILGAPWATNEPNNAGIKQGTGESCIQTDKSGIVGIWNDVQCTARFYPLCQRHGES